MYCSLLIIGKHWYIMIYIVKHWYIMICIVCVGRYVCIFLYQY